MAAYDIKQHFQGLRVETGRRKGRRDPFASEFSDDDGEEEKKSTRGRNRSNSERSAKTAPQAPRPVTGTILDQLKDSDDDDLLSAPPKRTDRRPSPAPPQIAAVKAADSAGRRGSLDKGLLPKNHRAPRSAVALAAGNLAYLDDSEDEGWLSSPKRSDRRPSPAPRKDSDPVDPLQRSHTPKGSREAPKEQSQTRSQPSRHTVASPFAGTKYLEDSESSGDEAISSRQGSADNSAVSPSEIDTLSPYESALAPNHPEVKRVDKPKQNVSGMSWRAFSTSRTEQRTAEIEAIQASLKQRGKSISFGTHAITDDGKRVPIPAAPQRQGSLGPGPGRGRGNNRGKSPPRRAGDVEPAADEVEDGERMAIYDPREFKTNPFSGAQDPDGESPSIAPSATQSDTANNHPASPPAFQTSESMMSHTHEQQSKSPPLSPTDTSAMTDSADSILSKLTVSPQTIPEGVAVEHSVVSPIGEITNPLSRNSSTRSTRTSTSRPARIPTAKRTSRRSTSANNSMSPAHAFLSSWTREGITAEPVAEPKPDDEGQAIGLDNEYIIGRTINEGGFGVIKEVHTITDGGTRVIRAVKIVRRAIPDKDAGENEKAQQDLEHEVSVWRHLDHRHILRLHATYDSEYATYCVMDLNVGGTLHDVVRKSRSSAGQNGGRKGLESKLAKSYAYQLACALRYLHEDIRVCHRDVKLENCLIDMSGPTSGTEGGILRLCDFGLADFLHSDSGMDDDGFSNTLSPSDHANPARSSVIGTLEYASPRGLSVNRKLFETAGDVWAFGVIVYALCTGELPFRHPMPSKTVELILRADWDDNALKQAAAGSDAVIELVKGCLVKEIDLRLTIGEALKNSWFQGCREDGEGSTSNVWR